ncbi:unnamed protein product [Symbiodinium natans]|uniref:Uncharacterized protein n=1 Tax=Symbiodinium natans TaxID=878477 RepID=A0A812JVK8_9DINO|nr:unnamed protein product [Symbiodinium natans]
MAWLRAMAVWMAYVATVLLAIPARAAEDGDGTASEVPSPDARKMHLAEALAISAADILDDQETPAVEGYDALSDLLESAVVAESFTYWELAQAVHDVLLQQGYNEEVMAPMMTHLSRAAASASGEPRTRSCSWRQWTKAASDGASSLSCSIWKGQAYQPRLSSVQIEISDDWGRGSTCVNGHWKSWGYGSGWAAAANTGEAATAPGGPPPPTPIAISSRTAVEQYRRTVGATGGPMLGGPLIPGHALPPHYNRAPETMGAGELVEELTWHLQGAGWTPAWCMSPEMRHRLQVVFAVLEARQIPPEDVAWRLITHIRGRHAVELQLPYAQRGDFMPT